MNAIIIRSIRFAVVLSIVSLAIGIYACITTPSMNAHAAARAQVKAAVDAGVQVNLETIANDTTPMMSEDRYTHTEATPPASLPPTSGECGDAQTVCGPQTLIDWALGEVAYFLWAISQP